MSSSNHGSVSASEKSPEKKQSINASDILSNLKVRVNNKLIIGNLNINSIAGKFDQLKLMVQQKVDILVLTKTKIDSSFLNQHYYLLLSLYFTSVRLYKIKYIIKIRHSYKKLDKNQAKLQKVGLLH